MFQFFPQSDVDFWKNLEKNGNFWEKLEVVNKKRPIGRDVFQQGNVD